MLRPAISAAEEGANPQTKDPISNIARPEREAHFAPYMVYSLPHNIWVAVNTNIYELPYYPTSFNE
jgi:hypothetical protein